MQVVVDATGDVELAAVRAPDDSAESVRHQYDLLFRGNAGRRDIKHEHVFAGILGQDIAAGIELVVVAAGQDEQGLAVGTDSGGFRAIGEVVWKIGQ